MLNIVLDPARADLLGRHYQLPHHSPVCWRASRRFAVTLRPVLTAAARDADRNAGRDKETANFRPNKETDLRKVYWHAALTAAPASLKGCPASNVVKQAM